MNISLIISGNLTGFSRFYASEGANDLLVEAKFDFDFRNHVTFLNENEKVYALSFSPTVYGISLITRSLDSFRRSGIVVLSLLVPRGYQIEEKGNPDSLKAVYTLLNELNESFYAHNMLNGMLNQNAAVLMQDYYADILDRYRLSSVEQQRRIGMSPVAYRMGYVQVADVNMDTFMPFYLQKPFRKSYEGYNHVFFAANAPQNISEEPEEVMEYSVVIRNNGRRIPSVRLRNKVERVLPETGETDFPQDYTYQEVLDGVCPQIQARFVDGDTIEMEYRFRKEERTLNFVFFDAETDQQMDFNTLRPYAQFSDDTKVNLTENHIFIGRELGQRIRIGLANSKYAIEDTNEIDLNRYADGSTIRLTVAKAQTLTMNFSDSPKPKKITLINKRTGKRNSYNVTSVFTGSIVGRPEEWSYEITSDYYMSERGQLSPNHTIRLREKRAVVEPVATPSSMQTVSRSGRPNNVQQRIGTQNVSQQTTKTTQPDDKKSRSKFMLSAIAGGAAVFLVLLFLLWPSDETVEINRNDGQGLIATEDSVPTPTEPVVEKVIVTIKLVAKNGGDLRSSLINKYYTTNSISADNSMNKLKAETDIKSKINALEVEDNGNKVVIDFRNMDFKLDFEWDKGTTHIVTITHNGKTIGTDSLTVSENKSTLEIKINTDWYTPKKETDVGGNPETPVTGVVEQEKDDTSDHEGQDKQTDLDGLDIDDKRCPDTNRGRAILAIYKNLNAKKINALSTENLSTVQQAFVASIKKYYQGIPDDKKAEFAVKLAEMSNSHKTLKAISARLNALAESCGYTETNGNNGANYDGQ